MKKILALALALMLVCGLMTAAHADDKDLVRIVVEPQEVAPEHVLQHRHKQHRGNRKEYNPLV